MHQYKILVVAPYEGLREVVRTVSEKYENALIDILVANLSSKELIVERIKENNFDALISRGGLVEFIRTINPKPTIEMELTALDMIRVLKLIEGYKGKKVLAAYHNIADAANTVRELIQTEIDIYEMQRYDYNTTEQNVDYMIQQGYSVIIGDTGTWNCARKKGVLSVLMTSGKEGFEDALKKTIEICEHVSKAQKETAVLEQLLKKTDALFEVTDEAGQVIYTSIPTTAYYEKVKKKSYDHFERSGRTLNQVIPIFEDKICCHAVFSKSAGMRGDLKILELKTDGNVINNVISTVNSQPGSEYVENIILKSNSGFTRKMVEQIEAFSKTNLPILLIGEKNSGKKDLARILHNKSLWNQREFLDIDCDIVSDQDIQSLFLSSCGIDIIPKGTLFLRNISRLSLENQMIVSKFLIREKNHQKYRIISSSYEDLEEMVRNKQFLNKLYRYISELKIVVPPLREYKQDIESISTFLISNFNIKYGKELVGLERKSLEALMEYDWPGNIYQFESVLIRIMLKCTKQFIPVSLVTEVLSEEAIIPAKTVIPDETLEEIERRIILAVLESENMNQSQAAKRLGIGRSTLWRKLNSI